MAQLWHQGRKRNQDVDMEAPAVRTELFPGSEHRPLCVPPASLAQPRLLEGLTKTCLFLLTSDSPSGFLCPSGARSHRVIIG